MRTKILILMIAIFMIGCAEDKDKAPAQTPAPIVEPIVEPITQQPLKIAEYDGSALYGYDVIGWYPLLTGNVLKARNNFYYSDQSGFPVLYGLNNMGAVISEQNLPLIPSQILKASNGDVYICENIPPADAYAQGGLYKDYVVIWINGVAQDHWSLNQWKCFDIIESENGEVGARASFGVYHGLNNTLAVSYTEHRGLIITDLNATPQTAKYNGKAESFIFNFAFNSNSKTWQSDGLKWYNANGYTWSIAGGLLEQSTVMWSWNDPNNYPVWAEAPVMLSVGTRFEVGETVIYWLECNTGWVYRYVPSVDRMDQAFRIYIGDGLKTTGIAKQTTVKPFIVDSTIYFTDAGSVNKLDMTTGMVSVFVGANVSAWGW